MNKKCQVFTPADYVEELLDSIGYKANIYGKKILENSCGDGKVLVAVVQRYIDDCIRKKISKAGIIRGLEADICGVEIDKEQYEKCICNLNKVLKANEIKQVKWSIYNRDYLRFENIGEFQFIVGNPPYITYKEMKTEETTYLKANFKSCEKGKFDYCYAFIEKSIDSLAEDGKMAYLIPSSIFKTVFGENLRNKIKPYIIEIQDFTQVKMFDNALVKSAIMVLSKKEDQNNLHYIDVAAEIEIVIDKANLNNKWFFTSNNILGEQRFGDYFKVSHVIASLLNEAYVLKEEKYEELDNHYQINGVKIEKAIVRETATPRSIRYGKTEKIIFPYNYENDKLVKFSEDYFKKKFPGAFQYLDSFRTQLEERKSDKKAKWFEYGRTQALVDLNHTKLLISTVVTDKVHVYLINKKCIPYAGMYIIKKKKEQKYGLEHAKVILESENFLQYVKNVGIHISGSSLRITSKDVEEYKF